MSCNIVSCRVVSCRVVYLLTFAQDLSEFVEKVMVGRQSSFEVSDVAFGGAAKNE